MWQRKYRGIKYLLSIFIVLVGSGAYSTDLQTQTKSTDDRVEELKAQGSKKYLS